MTSPAPWLDARARLTAGNVIDPALVEWPNEPFAKPDNALWISVRDSGEGLAPLELFGGAWQETGAIHFAIMSPAGSGTLAARQLAKAVANLFRDLPAAPVVYTESAIGDGGLMDTKGMWYGLTCTIYFRYQDVTS